jgi:hypothetical protein
MSCMRMLLPALSRAITRASSKAPAAEQTSVATAAEGRNRLGARRKEVARGRVARAAEWATGCPLLDSKLSRKVNAIAAHLDQRSAVGATT